MILFANEFKIPVATNNVGFPNFTQNILHTQDIAWSVFGHKQMKTKFMSPSQDIIPLLPGCITVTSACLQDAEEFSVGFIHVDNNKGDRKFTDDVGWFSNLI